MQSEIESKQASCAAIVEQIFDFEESDQPFGKRWWSQTINITPAQWQAVNEGKILALDANGEYVVYLKLSGDEHD